MLCVERYISRLYTSVNNPYGVLINFEQQFIGSTIKVKCGKSDDDFYFPTIFRGRHRSDITNIYNENIQNNTECIIHYPVVVSSSDPITITGLSGLIKYAADSVFYKLTYEGKTYYTGHGVILNGDFDIVMLTLTNYNTTKLKIIFDRRVISHGSKVEKSLLKEMVNSICYRGDTEIIITDTSAFIEKPSKPNPNDLNSNIFGKCIVKELKDDAEEQENQECNADCIG